MRTEPPAVDVDLMRPVYVAGADRSGTTLMFALLGSHPDLSMTRRTNMWRYFHRRYGDLSVPANLDRCLDEMMRYRRMRHLEPDEARIRRDRPDLAAREGQRSYMITWKNGELRVGQSSISFPGVNYAAGDPTFTVEAVA